MARWLLTSAAEMNNFQLTVVVRDPMSSTETEHRFLRSPATVGRADGSALRLDEAIVSRHHGAFLFGESGLHYVDLQSANGSFVHGVQIEPHRPLEIDRSSLVSIGPFQIAAEMSLIEMDAADGASAQK